MTFCGLVYHLAADQNLEETRNKKKYFSNKGETNNQWSKSFHWYKTEERFIGTKKSPTNDDKCDCCFFNYFIAKSMKKSDWVCCQKYYVCYMKHAWVRKARGIHLWLMPLIRNVRPSDRNCEYGGTFSITCKEISNFFL